MRFQCSLLAVWCLIAVVGCHDSSVQSERERILEERLELEHAKAEFEKQKRLEVEQKQRKTASAGTYSSYEYNALRTTIIEGGDNLGQMLIAATHPTGTYSYTDKPTVGLSSDSKTVSSQVRVHWKGGFTENPYTTTFSFKLKKSGMDRLEVLNDTAIINISPSALKSAEASLRSIFD